MNAMREKEERTFPKTFLWGAGSGSYQVEGGGVNQWSVWERENAQSLAAQSSYHYGDLPSWSTAQRLAKLPANYISGSAVKHYSLYEEDFDLLTKLNMNAYKFSIEWSRIEPTQGAWDVSAISHYKKYLKALRSRGIEPVVTLFHYTLPVWFDELGGFEKASNIEHFIRFIDKVMEEMGVHIKYVVTIQTPNVYVQNSYLEGAWPPQVKSRARAFKVLFNLAKAHNKAYRVIKEHQARAKVGVAYSSSFVYPGDDAILSRASARYLQFVSDDFFLGRVVKRSDYIGVAGAVSDRVYGYRVHNPDGIVSDTGDGHQPEDIEYTINRLYDKYKLPILVTDNGIADADDDRRKEWIQKTVVAIQNSMKDGSKVVGYIYKSLTDGFEWTDGRWPRYGLARVNYRTYERALRDSATWYGRAIKKLRRL